MSRAMLLLVVLAFHVLGTSAGELLVVFSAWFLFS